MQVTAYIALGSNLETPLQQVTDAVSEINQLPESTVVKVSTWYRSAPLGPADQPDFINGALALNTSLPALELLDHLQAIEQRHHRRRERHWGPRTLDLDLILYGDQVINHPRLTVPHPGVSERDFVLRPLFDISPQLSLPDGRSIESLLSTSLDSQLSPITSHEHQDGTTL